MKNKQNIVVVVLMLTAMVMSALLVTSLMSARDAQASTGSRGLYSPPHYVMASAKWGIAQRDAMYVLDIYSRQMNIYWVDAAIAKQNAPMQIKMVTCDLDRLFK